MFFLLIACPCNGRFYTRSTAVMGVIQNPDTGLRADIKGPGEGSEGLQQLAHAFRFHAQRLANGDCEEDVRYIVSALERHVVDGFSCTEPDAA